MCVSEAAVEQLWTDRPSDGGDGVYADELDSQQDLKTLPYIKSVNSLCESGSGSIREKRPLLVMSAHRFTVIG